jgi:hypothetical protein
MIKIMVHQAAHARPPPDPGPNSGPDADPVSGPSVPQPQPPSTFAV